MLRLNEKASPEYLEFSRRMIIEEQLVTGREGGAESIGRITRERFAGQIQQLEHLGVIKRGAVAIDNVMDASFCGP